MSDTKNACSGCKFYDMSIHDNPINDRFLQDNGYQIAISGGRKLKIRSQCKKNKIFTKSNDCCDKFKKKA